MKLLIQEIVNHPTTKEILSQVAVGLIAIAIKVINNKLREQNV